MTERTSRLAALSPEARRALQNRLAQGRRAPEDSRRIPRRPPETERIPLSHGQQRLWFLDQLEGPSAGYNVPLVFEVAGPLNTLALRSAISDLVDRHEALRCEFHASDAGPYQQVVSDAVIQVADHDTTGLIDPLREAESIVTAESLRPFDLSSAPLLRAAVVRVEPVRYVVSLVLHHIVCDGWSLVVLQRDLLALYARRCGEAADLPELYVQYPDFAHWQRNDPRATDGTSIDHWIETLGDAPGALALPYDRQPTKALRADGARVHVEVDHETAERLAALAQEEGVSLFMVLLAAFKTLLWRFTTMTDVVVGSSSANRARPELQPLIGLFVNTLALRTVLTPDAPFRELLHHVRTTTLDAQEHQHVPFEHLVERLRPDRSATTSPIFQVMFELETGTHASVEVGELMITPIASESAAAKFDLSVEVRPTASGGLRVELEFRTQLFDRTTALRLLASYGHLLRSAVDHPGARLRDLAVVPPDERRQLVGPWSGFDVDLGDRLSHQLFEDQVDRSPDAVAASCDGVTISYAALDAEANGIAHALLRAGVGPEDRVVLALERGIDYLTSMLGVLKAGGAFVPIDLHAPVSRVAEIIDLARPKVIISSTPLDAEVNRAGTPVLVVGDVDHTSLPKGRPQCRVGPRDLAYAIFTSGSTGQPKAAMIEHEGFVNHLHAKVSDLEMSSNDVVGQIAVATFDVSIWQLLAPLISGGRTAILTGDRAWVPDALLKSLAAEGVTILESVPSHTSLILDELELESAESARCRLGALRLYISNGEAMTVEQARRWYDATGGVKLINAFGATECSDDTSHLHIPSDFDSDSPYVHIGGPLQNARTYILDEDLEPVPVGVHGEVCIGGIAVGRGYFDDPAKTAAAFRPDPFSSVPGSRLYCMGDIARYREDRTIEFVGRKDFQVKIRGIRIELGETEAVLARLPEIRDVVVTTIDSPVRGAELIAYVVPSVQPAPSPAQLRSHCANSLPAHQVPAAVVLVDALPVTSSGKVDRTRLPSPPSISRALEDHVAPRTELEGHLARLWAAYLDVDRVGVTDDFFELGGHSLLAVRLIEPLQDVLGAALTLRDLFERPTIAGLAEWVAESSALSSTEGRIGTREQRRFAPTPRDPMSDHPLAPNQIAEWFAYCLQPNSAVYNVSFAELFFTDLDVDRFLAAWQLVLDRHDIFRYQFSNVDGRPIQRLGPRPVLAADEVVIDRQSLVGAAAETESANLAIHFGDMPFDLEQGAPFRLHLVRYGDGRDQLIFVVHHIVWDETSTMLLMLEVSEAYNAAGSGRKPQLPDLPLRYSDYAQWMDQLLASGSLEDDREFWLRTFEDLPAPLELPTDRPRPAVQTFDGRTVASWLPRDLIRDLHRFNSTVGATLFMTVMAAIDAYLFRVTGQDDLVLGCPIAGRDEDGFDHLLGLFASPIPVRVRVSPEMNFADLVSHVRVQAADSLEHRRYPVSRLVEELALKKDLSRPQLFSVMYGLQNNKTELLNQVNLDGTTVASGDLYNAEAHGARFDLTFVLDEVGGDIALNCIYNTDLFNRTSAERIVDGITQLLTGALVAPDARIDELPILSEDERRRLVVDLNDSSLPVEHATIGDLLAARRAASAADPAVIVGGVPTSFDDLDVLVRRSVDHFGAAGIGAGTRVGLSMAPSLEAIVAMVALLEMEASYVPIDPSTPPGRAARIEEDAGLCTVLAADFGGCPAVSAGPDIAAHAALKGPSAEAYVLFTSGTTGEPKGVPISHEGVVNLITSTQESYGLDRSDRVLHTTPLAFDASVLEVFWPLAYGAAVVLPGESRRRDAASLLSAACEGDATVIQCVPSMLEAFLTAAEVDPTLIPPRLRLVISGGSLLTRPLLDRARAVLGVRIVNHYGPTEVCVDATSFDCDEPFEGDAVPIGRPIANAQVHVLDSRLEPLPIGVPGSIYVWTPGLTVGYLQPESADHAFTDVDFGYGAGHIRLYRTGDVGKRDEFGRLVFLGRADKQLQVRGVRVEPEEIDLVLSKHPAVSDAVTLAGGAEGAEQLVSFVELHRSRNSVHTAGEAYRVLTLEQRPDLAKAMNLLHLRSWPTYFDGDPVLAELWPRLNTVFPAFQFGLMASTDRLAAVGNAVPLRWSGEIEELPAGWSAGLRQAFELQESGGEPDTMLILTALVDSPFAGRGLSGSVLRSAKSLAQSAGLERVVVVVRPTAKIHHPEVDFGAWCAARRPDGQLEDPWLRVHERIGGQVLHVCPRSQEIVGSLEDWRRWTGSTLDLDGTVMLPGTLQPAVVQATTNSVRYDEPGVWVRHTVGDGDLRLDPVSPGSLRQHASRHLPTYLVPDRVIVVGELPRLVSGKIDEGALRIPDGRTSAPAPAENATHTGLLALWQSILELTGIGIDDDFFQLGGQSLKVLEMLAAVDDRFGRTIPLRSFYDDTSIRGLATRLGEAQ